MQNKVSHTHTNMYRHPNLKHPTDFIMWQHGLEPMVASQHNLALIPIEGIDVAKDAELQAGPVSSAIMGFKKIYTIEQSQNYD